MLLPKKGWNYSVQDTREAFTTSELYPEAIERSHSTVEGFFSGETSESLARFSDILLLGHDYSEDSLNVFNGCCTLLKVRMFRPMARPFLELEPSVVARNGNRSQIRALKLGFNLQPLTTFDVQLD